ncbi:endothelin-converting enzyme 2-like [Haemaphysalis longicornis]
MLALVVGLAALVVYIRLRRRADTPCVAPACVQLDAMLVEAQDKSVSPCDNFYQHTCGGWMRKHNTSVYRVRRAAFFQRLDDYLSKIKVATQHGATEKAAHFYQVCTDVVNGKRDNLDDFKKAFRNAGILWPYLGRSSNSSPNDALLVAARVFTTFYVGSLLTIRGHLTDMGAFLHLEPDVSLPLWNSALRVFGKGTAQYRNYYDKCVNQFAGRPESSEDTVNFTELLKIEHMMITRLLPARKTVKDLTLQSPQALNEYLNESRVQKLVKYYTDTYTPSGRAGAIISGIEYLGNFTDILDKVGDDKVIFYLGHVLIQPEEHQVDALLYIMGDQAEDIFGTFNLTGEDSKTFSVVMERFDKYFIPRRNVIFERARFNTRIQQETESVEEFATALHALSKHCEYGSLQEEFIRDRNSAARGGLPSEIYTKR